MLLLERAQDPGGKLAAAEVAELAAGALPLAARDHVRGLQGAAVGQGDALRVGWRLAIGEALPCTVVGASGSLNSWKSDQTFRPAPAPNRCCAAWRDWASAELAAAALAEDPGDQRGDRDHVGDLPLVARQADALRGVDQAVLAGQLRRVGAGLGDELVDAGDVVVDVLLDLHALLPVEPCGAVVLLLEVGLAVGRVGPDRLVHGGVGAARERRELGAAGVAQRVDHEQAILGGGVSGAEHRSRRGSRRRCAGRRSLSRSIVTSPRGL